MYARSRKKPLWKLVVDFTPEEFVQSAAFRYISDAITKKEALAMLKEKEAAKKEREAKVIKLGYIEPRSFGPCESADRGSYQQLPRIRHFCWLARSVVFPWLTVPNLTVFRLHR